jgi:transposase
MFVMKSQRRAFTPEFKDEAVKLVVNTARPVATVARELGIVEQTLSHWVKTYRDHLHDHPDGKVA